VVSAVLVATVWYILIFVADEPLSPAETNKFTVPSVSTKNSGAQTHLPVALGSIFTVVKLSQLIKFEDESDYLRFIDTIVNPEVVNGEAEFDQENDIFIIKKQK